MDPDQTLRSAASDLGLQCLPRSKKWHLALRLSEEEEERKRRIYFFFFKTEKIISNLKKNKK